MKDENPPDYLHKGPASTRLLSRTTGRTAVGMLGYIYSEFLDFHLTYAKSIVTMLSLCGFLSRFMIDENEDIALSPSIHALFCSIHDTPASQIPPLVRC